MERVPSRACRSGQFEVRMIRKVGGIVASLNLVHLTQWLVWASLALTAGCGVPGDDYDFQKNVFLGDAASERCHKDIPASATDIYFYDGGNWNGSINYISFTCDTVEECWAAVAALGAPDREEFLPSIQSAFAVNIHGPSFYAAELETEYWHVPAATNGASFEKADGSERMTFWAIDFDKNRVFYHYESGGFPADPPSVRYSWENK